MVAGATATIATPFGSAVVGHIKSRHVSSIEGGHVGDEARLARHFLPLYNPPALRVTIK